MLCALEAEPLANTPAPPRDGGAGAAAGLRRLLVACVVATLALGLAKVLYQRAHPPAWAHGMNRYEGFVSIDWFAKRAEEMRSALVGADPGGERLLAHLREDYHPTAMLVPALVALASLALGSIPWSFVLVSAAAFVAQVGLAATLARRIAGERGGVDPRPAAAAAGVVLAAHCLSARTAAQLQIDGACAALALATVLAADAWARRPGLARAAGLGALLAAALLTKASCLPLLAVPALAAWIRARDRRRRALGAALAVSACALVPALAWVAWLDLERGASDVTQLFGQWRLRGDQLALFALEMALLFQLLPLALALRRGVARAPAARLALASALLLLASTWAFRLPAVPRLYAPVLALLAAPVAVALCELVRPERRLAALGAYALANYSVAAAGLYAS